MDIRVKKLISTVTIFWIIVWLMDIIVGGYYSWLIMSAINWWDIIP